MLLNLKKQIVIIFMIFSLSILLAACSAKVPPQDNTPQKTAGNSAEELQKEKEEEQQKLVEQIMELAKQGKVPGCSFAAGQSIFEEIQGQFGEPDTFDYVAAAKGNYAVYGFQGFVFGINKGSQVFEVRSMREDIKELTVSRVKDVLGEPEKVLHYNDQDILGYEAGQNFKLEFVFPAANQEEDPVLDHLNVLYPRGTINMMADDPGRQW